MRLNGGVDVDCGPYMARTEGSEEPVENTMLQFRGVPLSEAVPKEYLARAEEGDLDFVKQGVAERMAVLRLGHESGLTLHAIDRTVEELKGLRLISRILSGNGQNAITA